MEKMFVYNNHIGSRRILKADEVAQNMGYQAVVLPGYADYYPQFVNLCIKPYRPL